MPILLQKTLQGVKYSEKILIIATKLQNEGLKCDPISILHNVDIPFREDGYIHGREHKRGKLKDIEDFKIKEVIEKALTKVDNLDINLKIVEGELTIDVYGSEFLGEYLRKNINNAFIFMEELLKHLEQE